MFYTPDEITGRKRIYYFASHINIDSCILGMRVINRSTIFHRAGNLSFPVAVILYIKLQL